MIKDMTPLQEYQESTWNLMENVKYLSTNNKMKSLKKKKKITFVLLKNDLNQTILSQKVLNKILIKIWKLNWATFVMDLRKWSLLKE